MKHVRYVNTGHDEGEAVSFIEAFHTTSLVKENNLLCMEKYSLQWETFQTKFANACSLGHIFV